MQVGSGDRSELNLVPFIDLLSTLVIFLLTTAVWNQIAAIPASVENRQTPPNPSSVQSQRMVVQMGPYGFKLRWPETGYRVVGKKAGAFDFGALKDVLVSAKKGVRLESAVIFPEDSVEYAGVVQALDVTRFSGFAQVALGEE